MGYAALSFNAPFRAAFLSLGGGANDISHAKSGDSGVGRVLAGLLRPTSFHQSVD